jgi:signal transduction histidine kinase/DNA-binding response OmpR family regulator/CHASE3 domain sensor protein
MNSFKRNLLIGYGISLLLLVISAVASYISIRNLLYFQENVSKTNTVISNLDRIISELKDAETGQRGFLITNNPKFLEPYSGAAERAQLLINETRPLINDNPDQVVDINLLESAAKKRFTYLETVIQKKKNGEIMTDSLMVAGKSLMDNARNLVKKMQGRENQLLEARTASMNQFANITPPLIVIASVIAIFITIISVLRVLKDYNQRTAMQKELEKKDEEISRRLKIISNIADQISAGQYKLKVDDEGRDALGGIAVSLNKMSQSLDYSFSNLKDREWQQTGLSNLNDIMIGEKDLRNLTKNVLEQLTGYTESAVGAFYLSHPGDQLKLSSSVALDLAQVKPTMAFGEGIAGRSASERKPVLLTDLEKAELLIDYSGGSLKPASIVAVPIIYDNILKGVIELGSVNNFSPVVIDFLKTACLNIGMAIHSAKDHQRLQELLSETQAQSEELQVQHSELENINAELEAQAEKLQASEEELKVQQEELQQANLELEERSRLLEEKNELILERNLDIQQKADELELSTRYKSEFLANMSHELRTPLNSILLLSRLLSENHESNLSNDQIEYAQVIQSSGKGLLALIDDILDLSKIEAGKMDLEYTDVHTNELLQELKQMFEPMAREKNLQLEFEMGNDVPGIIESDRLRLEQILRNLISNALKFTKKGRVTLSATAQDKNIAFKVTDTGIGIPEDKLQTVFEAFQQADGSTRRKFGGTGLGLSISRELAKLLGGEILIESKEGQGSTFTLIVPVNRVQQPAQKNQSVVHQQSERIEQPKNISQADSRFTTDIIPVALPDDRNDIHPNDKVILIIEDDTGFAKSLLDYTRAKGYKGLVSVRGDEGIELAKKFKPLGILLDVQLPVKNGWEVMEELKSDKSTRHIPIHMMSSYEVKTKSLSKGAVDFINKPVAYEKLGEMFEKIDQALKKHPKKVLIVEENPKHAEALAVFLDSNKVNSEIRNSIDDGIKALNQQDVDCVILDMGVPAQRSYDMLENVKKSVGLENVPIIVFTGKNLSHVEEMKIKQYADSIVVKTAHSYQRILDEVSLFLHLVEENTKEEKTTRYKRMGELGEVLKGKTILIADDDVRNIFSLTKLLENYGMNVVTAIDGNEALNQLESNKIDLVLMDMMMPEMDGYESTKRIRNIQKYRNLPVIAVTAKAMTGDREKCINAGASDYITKPVDIDQLISLLRVWLYQ